MSGIKVKNMVQLLGEGTYGCVLRGISPCDKHNAHREKFVSKVYGERREAKKESDMYDKLATKIDPERAFTLTKYGHCVRSFPDRKGDLKKCSIVSRGDDDAEFDHIMIEDGGYDLDHWIQNRDVFFEELFLNMRPLFKGLIQLEQNGYLHADIKGGNILYDQDTEKMKYGDVGLMTHKKMLTSNKVYYTFYPFYPPDLLLVEFDDTDKWSELDRKKKAQNINDIYEPFADFLSFLPVNTSLELSSLYNVLHRKMQYKGAIEKLTSDRKKYIENVKQKWDVYSLGLVVWDAVAHKLDQGKCSLYKSSYLKDMAELIEGMTHFNVFERFTPQEAYDKYISVLKLVTDVVVHDVRMHEIRNADIPNISPHSYSLMKKKAQPPHIYGRVRFLDDGPETIESIAPIKKGSSNLRSPQIKKVIDVPIRKFHRVDFLHDGPETVVSNVPIRSPPRQKSFEDLSPTSKRKLLRETRMKYLSP